MKLSSLTPQDKIKLAAEFVEIPLKGGEIAIIDKDDYERVSKIKWYASRYERTTYVLGYDGTDKHVRLHRFVLNNPSGCIAHMNGNGLDNRKANLRVATQQQNMSSFVAKSCDAASQYRGVSINRGRGKRWVASLTHKGKYIYLGKFAKQVDAAMAYDKKTKELNGEFAHLNFPETNLDALLVATGKATL